METEQSLITIKVGQVWLRRDGLIVPIDAISPDDAHPIKHGKMLCWQANGRYWSDEFDHSKDIIKRIDNI